MDLARLLAEPNQHHKRTITADSQNSVVNERGGLAAGFGQIPRYGAVPVEKLWTLCRRRIFLTGNKQTQRIRVSRVAPGTLALYAARNRIQQNAMKHHLAARSAPAPRKPRLIVLTVERNS